MAMRRVTARPPSLAAGARPRAPAAAANCARTGGGGGGPGDRRTPTTTTTTAPLRISDQHHHHHPRRATLLRARATSPERANSSSSSASISNGSSSSSSNRARHARAPRPPPPAAAAGGGGGGGGGSSGDGATAAATPPSAASDEPMTSLADLDALRARLTARLAATVDEQQQRRIAPSLPLPRPPLLAPSPPPSPPPPAAAAAAPAAPAPSPPPFHRLPSPNSPTSPENVARRLAAASASLPAAAVTVAAAAASDSDRVADNIADNADAATTAPTAASQQQTQKQQDEEWHPSLGWRPSPNHLSNEALWAVIRAEARAWADAEPALASFLYSSVLVHPSLERALAFVLGNKLASPTLFSTHLMKMIGDAYAAEPALVDAAAADLQAVHDRDPACEQYAQGLLLFKGYAAVQCHRVAHHLWARGRRALAVALQSRVSEAFHVDVHPAASLGRGVMIDHATGVVIGETAVVGDNVSMLHHVTLGGSGTRRGVRHPTVGHGVLLGAGVSVLGPVVVGCGCKVGAGSVVVADLPPHSVAVGVPARVVKIGGASLEPVADMDQTAGFALDYVI